MRDPSKVATFFQGYLTSQWYSIRNSFRKKFSKKIISSFWVYTPSFLFFPKGKKLKRLKFDLLNLSSSFLYDLLFFRNHHDEYLLSRITRTQQKSQRVLCVSAACQHLTIFTTYPLSILFTILFILWATLSIMYNTAVKTSINIASKIDFQLLKSPYSNWITWTVESSVIKYILLQDLEYVIIYCLIHYLTA